MRMVYLQDLMSGIPGNPGEGVDALGRRLEG